MMGQGAGWIGHSVDRFGSGSAQEAFRGQNSPVRELPVVAPLHHHVGNELGLCTNHVPP